MITAIIFCFLYAVLNVSGAAIIKWKLKGRVLTEFSHLLNLLLDFHVILAFGLIFVSALMFFKALSLGQFTLIVPVATGINFALTVIAGYLLFKDQINLVSFIGFACIISGIILLSLNNRIQHA